MFWVAINRSILSFVVGRVSELPPVSLAASADIGIDIRGTTGLLLTG